VFHQNREVVGQETNNGGQKFFHGGLKTAIIYAVFHQIREVVGQETNNGGQSFFPVV
jgi:hypothetical protein